MRALIRRGDVQDPFAVMDRMLNRWAGVGELPAQLAPYAVDVHEDADHIYVEAELPGFTKDDVNITLEEGVLTIQAERKSESRQREPLHVERRWTQFQRAFTLPTAVNENTVTANLEGGLLTVTLDKREENKPRKISITAGEGNGTHKAVEVKNEQLKK